MALPEDRGAIGDGVTDDTAALKATFAALRPGDALHLTGAYRHSSSLVVTAPDVTIGGGGHLIGTNQTACAVQIDGDRVTVEDLTLTVVGVTKRQTANRTAGLLVGGTGPVTGFRGRRLHIRNAASAGVMVRGGSTDFELDDITVTDSWADGIHLTGGVSGGRIRRPVVLRPGDDGIAVVSYTKDPAACRDIDIDSPHVRAQNNGRGLSVVGGQNITYRDIAVAQTSGAAVYIACEKNRDWHTYPAVDVRVIGGTIDGANLDSPNPDHGAVLVVNQNTDQTIRGVDITALTIRDTHSIYRTVGFLGKHDGCRLSDVLISGRAPRLIVENTGGPLEQTNVRVGVTQFVPHHAETWLTNPNGRLSGAQSSTAALLDGSCWMKTTPSGTAGWVRIAA